MRPLSGRFGSFDNLALEYVKTQSKPNTEGAFNGGNFFLVKNTFGYQTTCEFDDQCNFLEHRKRLEDKRIHFVRQHGY